MIRSRRICLLIDTSTSWGVRLIKGISRHAHEVGDWLIHVEPWGRYERFRLPEGWDGDGIIARINHEALADEVTAIGLPTINLSWHPLVGKRIARCTVDPEASGRMAAEYFLSAGFKQFAYCGPLHRLGFRDLFAEAFCLALTKCKFGCNFYPTPGGDQQSIAWNAHLASLVEWLQQLPRPVAVLCWSAARGRQVTEACHYAGIRVPDDVSVLGGDYDELMSHISSPPLSTIDQPAEQIGYEAARLLEGMMHGKKAPKRPLLFPPTRIVVRHSTDILAIDDEMVRDALRLIRERAHDGVRINSSGNFSMRYNGTDFDSGVLVTAGQWSHIMVIRPAGAAGGSRMYINGVARITAPGGYDDDWADLVLGANTAGDDGGDHGDPPVPPVGFTGGTTEFFSGIIDDLEMFVMGKTPPPAEIDYGSFDFGTENDFAATQVSGVPGDVTNNGTFNSADKTAFIAGWLDRRLVGGIQVGDMVSLGQGDLNFDGITDIRDLIIMQGALAGAGMGAITAAELAGTVPEPSATVLGLWGSFAAAFLGRSRRQNRR
ncbi:MAG: substrate-binding domain-containing protein [Planctomycetes bacterium]|nr:substrate-binding domain-containing protein [Planctomycetota bacterium]